MIRFMQLICLTLLCSLRSVCGAGDNIGEAPVSADLRVPSISVYATDTIPQEVRDHIDALNRVLKRLTDAGTSNENAAMQCSQDGRSMAFLRRDIMTRSGHVWIWPSWQKSNTIIEFDYGVVEYVSNDHVRLGYGDDAILVDLRAPEQEIRIPPDLQSLRFASDNHWCALRENLLTWGRVDRQTLQFEATMTSVRADNVLLLRDGQYAVVEHDGVISTRKRGGTEAIGRMAGTLTDDYVDDAFIALVDSKTVLVHLEADGTLLQRTVEGMEEQERLLFLSPSGGYLITRTNGPFGEAAFQVRATPRAGPPPLVLPRLAKGSIQGWLAWR